MFNRSPLTASRIRAAYLLTCGPRRTRGERGIARKIGSLNRRHCETISTAILHRSVTARGVFVFPTLPPRFIDLFLVGIAFATARWSRRPAAVNYFCSLVAVAWIFPPKRSFAMSEGHYQLRMVLYGSRRSPSSSPWNNRRCGIRQEEGGVTNEVQQETTDNAFCSGAPDSARASRKGRSEPPSLLVQCHSGSILPCLLPPPVIPNMRLDARQND